MRGWWQNMWKAPNRPNHEISQSYNDGIVTICDITDVSKPGNLPVEKLTARVSLHYGEQRMGVARYYAAQQNQNQIERVIRVQRVRGIHAQDVALTEDGQQYRIDLVQTVDDVFPPSLDLTLAKVTQIYEVDDEME